MTDMQPQPADTTNQSEKFAPPSGEPVIDSLLDDLGRPVGTFDRAMAAKVQSPDAFYGAYTEEAMLIDRVKDQAAQNERLDEDDRFEKVIGLGFTTLATLNPDVGMKNASEYLDQPIPPGSGVNKDTKKTTDKIEEKGKEVDLWTKLTPEQKTYAEESITKMAEKFNRPKEDFGLIEVTEKDQEGNNVTKTKAILTATKGIDLGIDRGVLYSEYFNTNSEGRTVDGEYQYYSDDEITMRFKSDEHLKIFGIELNGTTVDLRDALTEQALIELSRLNPEIDEPVWAFNEFMNNRRRGGVEELWYEPIVIIDRSHTYKGKYFKSCVDRGFGGNTPDQIRGRDIVFRPAVTIN